MIYSAFVKPNSKKGPLILESANELTIYLREKPIDGAANIALLKLLAQHFRVPRSQIIIKSGAHSRKKLIEILPN